MSGGETMNEPEVIWSSRKSMRATVPTLVVLLALASAALVVGSRMGGSDARLGLYVVGAGFGVVALLIWFSAWFGTIGTEYRVDSHSVFQRSGILSRRTAQVSIRDIRSINMNQTLGQRILGVGDVLIGSAGQEGIEIAFIGVDDPQGVVDTINRMRRPPSP